VALAVYKQLDMMDRNDHQHHLLPLHLLEQVSK